jgi:chorismate mutase/prephenate dehydrogenase
VSADPSSPPPSLAALRDRIQQLDRELVGLAAERVKVAREIGRRKREEGLPTVDYAQERRVLDAAQRRALRAGLDTEVAQDLVARLIRASVSAQEEDSLRHSGHGQGRSAVIVGGAGRMGRWMTRFLSAQGWAASVLDPRATPAENREARETLFGSELVLLAAPPRGIAAIYADWLDEPPRGVLVDLASIKTPLVAPIRALQEAGARVASIHPMFGPSTLLLRDSEVVVCDTGDEEATRLAETLFAPTTARVVRVPLAEHDRIMADLLSLAHATAIAFALALPDAEHPVHSTTFQALETLAAAVVRENPDVYYEIQAENPHSLEALERLQAAVERVHEAVTTRSPELFAELLVHGRRRTPGA